MHAAHAAWVVHSLWYPAGQVTTEADAVVSRLKSLAQFFDDVKPTNCHALPVAAEFVTELTAMGAALLPQTIADTANFGAVLGLLRTLQSHLALKR